MKNNRIKILNFDINLFSKRIPKSVSLNETFEKTVSEKIDYTVEQQKHIDELLEKKEYKKVIEYKEDLLFKNKIKRNKPEN